MRANAVGKEWSEVDKAYLAGLIDGDGAIMALIESHNEKKFKFRVRIELKVTQKERKDVSFIPKLTSCGKVSANRTTYDWITRDQKEILRILTDIRPYTRAKRKQVKLAIQILTTLIESEENLLQVAKSADTLSRFNVRSANRRKNYVAMIQEHFSRND